MMTLEYCHELPKIELHAHLNGSLSVSTIGKLVRLHKQSFPEEVVPPAAEIFQDPKSFDDGYAIFKCAQALVDHPEAVKLATSSVLKEFSEENVIYIELRSTPRHCEEKMTKRQYIEAMIMAIKEQNDITAKILISVDRRKSVDEANENVSLALEFHQEYPDIVVGVDLSGDARVNKLQDFYPVLIKAKEKGLKIAMHFAEENNPSEIDFVLSEATFKPDRLGHCTHVYPFWSKFVELQIPTEICLTSNVKCGSVQSYQDHHLKKFHESNLPFCICTDDKGVFKCSSSDEHSHAMQLLGLNHEEMFILSMQCIDFIFAPESVKLELKSKFIEKKAVLLQ